MRENEPVPPEQPHGLLFESPAPDGAETGKDTNGDVSRN